MKEIKSKNKKKIKKRINILYITYIFNFIVLIHFPLSHRHNYIRRHPRQWREAIGVVLKKPNKLDDTIPKAYRVISLLNYLGKVAEKIITTRLSYLAETIDLLYPK